MKISKWVQCDNEHEVEVHISADDLRVVLSEVDSETSIRTVKSLVSSAYGVLKSLPEDVIAQLGAENRALIVKGFEEQIARFKVSVGDQA